MGTSVSGLLPTYSPLAHLPPSDISPYPKTLFASMFFSPRSHAARAIPVVHGGRDAAFLLQANCISLMSEVVLVSPLPALHFVRASDLFTELLVKHKAQKNHLEKCRSLRNKLFLAAGTMLAPIKLGLGRKCFSTKENSEYCSMDLWMKNFSSLLWRNFPVRSPQELCPDTIQRGSNAFCQEWEHSPQDYFSFNEKFLSDEEQFFQGSLHQDSPLGIVKHWPASTETKPREPKPRLSNK